MRRPSLQGLFENIAFRVGVRGLGSGAWLVFMPQILLNLHPKLVRRTCHTKATVGRPGGLSRGLG